MNLEMSINLITKRENEEDQDNLDDEKEKRSLFWDHCSILYNNGRNGNYDSYNELEELSRRNSEDIICLSYLLLLIDRSIEFSNKLKYNQLTLQIQEIINKITSERSLFDYLKDLTNKHELFIYGTLLDEGIGIERNIDESIRLLQLSADQSFSFAENHIGCCYGKGVGVSLDKELSTQYYLTAVIQGYSVAQYNVGFNYHEGCGVEKDLVKAVRWYKFAANQGYLNAKYNLGYCYENGLGVKKNLSIAYEL